jgi:hypothetical protein
VAVARSSEQPGERQRNHDAQCEQHQALSVLRFHDVAALSGSASTAALGRELRSKTFMPSDELCMAHQLELDELAALVTKRERLACDASHLVRLEMLAVVKNGIDSGLPNLVARLEHGDPAFGSSRLRPKDTSVKLAANKEAPQPETRFQKSAIGARKSS